MKLLFLMIEFILIFWAVAYIERIKVNVKQVLAYVLIIICPTALLYLLVGQWQGIMLIILSMFPYFYWLSRRYIILIHLCFVIIIGVIVDNLSQYAMNLIAVRFLPGMLAQYVMFALFFIAAVCIYRIVARNVYHVFGRLKSAYVLVLFVAFVTMSTFYINIYLTEYFTRDSLLKFNILTQIIYFSIMLFIVYFTTKNIKKENDMQKMKFETDQFTDYMHSLEIINHDMQRFRHDHANILFTMQGYMEINDFEGLKEYFKQHIFTVEEDTLKRNEQLSNLSKLHIPGIKGLVLTKTLQAENEGIFVDLEIADEIHEIDMNIIDIARVLGILLDNAIEANEQITGDKEMAVSFIESAPGTLMIIVENVIGSVAVDTDSIFAEGFSTKGEGRGKGLSTVKNVLAKYPHVTLTTNAEDGLFTQVLIIE